MCPHGRDRKHIRVPPAVRPRASRDAAVGTARRSPSSTRATGAGRATGRRVRGAAPGSRLRRRDARRSGGDRGALDRPRACSSRAWSSMLGASARRRGLQRVARRASDAGSHRCLAARLDRRGRRRAADHRRSIALVCAVLRKWRIAAFAVFALASSPRRTAPRRSSSTRTGRASFVSRPARERQLPVRSYGRVDRGLRRPRRCCSRRGSRAALSRVSPGRSSSRW